MRSYRLAAIVFWIASQLGAATRPATGPVYSNHLAGEKSPYLLQHAHNPVDWYPWGAEAFQKARKENKPIFLSVGYSTCHWCHVMERESFENGPIAKLLNEHFIAIKVDREERPDVDHLYMTFVQASTGSGGWPMNVFLTPDLKPFFGGTYFPTVDKDGMPGLTQVLLKVHTVWESDREKVVESAGKVAVFLQEAAKGTAVAGVIEPAVYELAAAHLKAQFDEKHGGFGRAPKFPEPVYLNFLLRYHAKTGDAVSRDMVLKTLRAMADGGIHDQIGGGFHRYSTDAYWFIPHFEKMLYDQAQIASAYVDAFQLTHEPYLAAAARDTLDYVLRDLTGGAGQFLSAEDADSASDPAKPNEKSEGAFYVWRSSEIAAVLGDPKLTELFQFAYGVKDAGNVTVDPREEFGGKNVLARAHSVDEVAAQFALKPEQVTEQLGAACMKLLARRQTRARPHRDDKVLAAWNGLAISAFAKAGAVLDEPRYTAAAQHAAAFLRDQLYDAKSHLLKRRFRDGQADIDGFAEDYAFVIQGLLDLYEAGFDLQWLKLALELQHKQDELFWDDTPAGGYFSTSATDTLLTRFKSDVDGVEPSANSVSAMNLLRLAAMTDNPELRQRGLKTLAAFGGKVRQSPESLTQLLVAGLASEENPLQVVLAGKLGSGDLQQMLREVHASFHPNKVMILADGGVGQEFFSERVGFFKDLKPIDGKATAYVCRAFVCQLPTTEASQLRALLQSVPTTRP